MIYNETEHNSKQQISMVVKLEFEFKMHLDWGLTI